MREIIFRGKNIDLQWVEGDLLQNGVDYKTAIRDYGERLVERVISHTVGQYTGLTDNNGKRIFEGDILKVKHGILGSEAKKPKMPRNAYGLHYKGTNSLYGRWFYYRNYVVEYKAHGNSRGKYIVRNGSDQCDFTNSLFLNHDAKIIGNIHDNPELLEGK